MLTTTEEQLVRQLLAEQAALLSLASSESEILSNLGGDQATLSDLAAATALADADLMLVRQGTTDKSVTGLKVKELAQTGVVLQSAFTGSNVSLTNTGYQKLPSGLIVQWGSVGPYGAGSQSVTFPISFTTAAYSLALGPYATGPGFTGSVSFNNLVPTGFSLYSSAGSTYTSYIAIGK